MNRLLAPALLFSIFALSVGSARAADMNLPTALAQVAGAPIRIDGCTAQRTDSEGGYVDDFYIRGNASFTNLYTSPATQVAVMIHYQGAYGDHDALLTKSGSFAPNVRIDPKRRAWIAMLQPEALNIDADGSREIDIWGTVSAVCAPVAARFADGSQWNVATGWVRSATTAQTISSPAPLPAAKCPYDPQRKTYACQ